MLVPTVDFARNKSIINMLLNEKISTMVVGATGTGKTVVINGLLGEVDDGVASANIVFSSSTTSVKT
jgi:Cdc6-like AAA superfamily ATPase